MVLETLILAGFASGCAFLLNPACDELAAQAETNGVGYEIAFGWFNVAYAVGNIVGPLSYGLIKHFIGMNFALIALSSTAILVWWLTKQRNASKSVLIPIEHMLPKAA